jgi:hypothetical protein
VAEVTQIACFTVLVEFEQYFGRVNFEFNFGSLVEEFAEQLFSLLEFITRLFSLLGYTLQLGFEQISKDGVSSVVSTFRFSGTKTMRSAKLVTIPALSTV